MILYSISARIASVKCDAERESMKQKYTVTVAGMTVNIVSDEQEEYVNGLVRLLDQRISEMVEGNRHCSKTDAILFCAIDYFDDKIKNSLRFQHMQETIEKLEAENASLRAMLGMPAREAEQEDAQAEPEDAPETDESSEEDAQEAPVGADGKASL